MLYLTLSLIPVMYLIIRVYALKTGQERISTGHPIQTEKRKNTALLVMDVQRDLFNEDGKAFLGLPNADEFIRKTNTIIKQANRNGWLVIYIQNEYRDDILLRMLTNGAMRPDSDGIALDDRLLVIDQGLRINKNKCDAFSNPVLENALDQANIGKLFILGADARYCVRATALAGLNRLYEVSLLDDLVATKPAKALTETLNALRTKGIGLVSSSALLSKKNRSDKN
ncbi:bifunctional pyrazinamidase/nicotinamidase [Fulvitalea axinellae]|uniref:Bifunctional pyrazinamidase/nicotinamidase n=1 Tax=Fulvitalea axinellae TaxID=1182444 RepID=A0AAU9CN78_9BACT|nr:bifunctional pyrazinamidase/nicotinamidase [Fulvitalea axinellae]